MCVPCRGQKVGSKDAAEVNISPATPGTTRGWVHSIQWVDCERKGGVG